MRLPRRVLVLLAALAALAAAGCKKPLTYGDFVKAYLAVTSPDGGQVAQGVQERREKAPPEYVYPEPDPELAALGGYTPPEYEHYFPVYLRDARTGKHVRSLRGHDGAVVSLAYSPDGSLLASGGEDALVCLWDARTGKRLHRLKGHWFEGATSIHVVSVAFSPDGRTLVSRDNARTVIEWDVATGRQLSSSDR